jgi:biopolymer transport protein ExbB
MRMLGLLLLVLSLGAAEPLDGARAAREAAEQQLAAARVRLHAEQADHLARLQAAVAAGSAARERLATASSEADLATAELSRRQQEQERGLGQVRQLADRAVVAARINDRELATKPPAARVEAAIAGLTRRIDALPQRLARRLADEPVVGRDGAVASVPVLRLGEARAVALGEGAHRGLLERAADGSSWLVVGPALPALPAGAVPFDAAGSAAHQPGAVQRTFGEWLAAGRAFIWPILAVMALGLAIIIERCIAFARRRVDPHRLAAVAEMLSRDDVAAASALVGAGAGPLDRVLRAGLAAVGRPKEAREAAVEQALLVETSQLGRGLTMLAVLAGVAPLLGLLGTVTGMIDMFSVIAAQGSGNARSLSGGISEALICTQAGMLAAIPLLIAHAWLSRRAERRTHLLEEAACGVLGLTERRP